MTSGVYKITNIVTGRYYIGSSYHCEERWKEHLKYLRNNTHVNKHLLNSYKKHGENNFKFEILHELPEDEARNMEQWYIDNYYNEMYNLSKTAYHGGDLISYHPNKNKIIERMTVSVNKRYENLTEEDREKQWGYMKIKGNPMQGRKHTEKSKQKMSENKKGNTAWNKGKTMSDNQKETLSKIASKRTGDKNSFYGKSHSEEFKEYMSEKFKGRIPTNARKVVINGDEFVSVTEASRKIGVVVATIINRIKSKNPEFSGYYYK